MRLMFFENRQMLFKTAPTMRFSQMFSQMQFGKDMVMMMNIYPLKKPNDYCNDY